VSVHSIAFAPSGQLYGIRGHIVAIDATTGDAPIERQLADFTDIRAFDFLIPEPAAAPFATFLFTGVTATRKKRESWRQR
jgi:hypothetical protein